MFDANIGNAKTIQYLVRAHAPPNSIRDTPHQTVNIPYVAIVANGIKVSNFTWVNTNKVIGTVGNTGNAKGKSPHLHYTILTAIPYVWRIDGNIQGWKKMFILNPIDYLDKT